MSLLNSFGSKVTLKIAGKDYTIYRLRALQECGVAKVLKLPYSIRVLLENLLRTEDGADITADDIKAIGYDVLRHRIMPSYEAEAEDVTSEHIIKGIFEKIPIP